MRLWNHAIGRKRNSGEALSYCRVNSAFCNSALSQFHNCTIYHPDDWDDDGDPNDTDPNPYACDGDFFGLYQELPQGANADAYCWVDIVVPNANALVTFTGDGPSALPDPRFVARAGETNRSLLSLQMPQALDPSGRAMS